MRDLADTGARREGGRGLPQLVVSDGTLETLKWLALVLMSIDHINKYLLHGSAPALFALGRIAFPLFAFVLAFNLARSGALARGTHKRMAARLLFFGAVASVPYIALGGLAAGWWPLNIMATFLAATGVIYLLERRGPVRMASALLLFLLAGAVVEFWWPAIALTTAAWCYIRRPGWLALLAWVLATLALNFNGWAFARMSPINASMWALAAFPIIFAATHVALRMPRFGQVFYLYFPLHLAVLWAIGSWA